MIHCDHIYDLLTTGNIASSSKSNHVRVECFVDQKSQEIGSKVIGLHERLITTNDQFHQMMSEAFKERRTYSSRLTDHDIRKRSHLVVQFALVRRLPIGFQELSILNFVELAGSEQSVTSTEAFMRDTTVRTFVTKSFNSLSTQLIKVATSKKNQFVEGENPIINCLRQTLTQSSKILLITCSSPTAQQFQHTLPAVKFCSRIRETIVRRLERRTLKQQLESAAPVLNPFASKHNPNVDLEDLEDVQNKINLISQQSSAYKTQVDNN